LLHLVARMDGLSCVATHLSVRTLLILYLFVFFKYEPREYDRRSLFLIGYACVHALIQLLAAVSSGLKQQVPALF